MTRQNFLNDEPWYEIPRDPEFPAPEVGDKGIIPRFELPTDE